MSHLSSISPPFRQNDLLRNTTLANLHEQQHLLSPSSKHNHHNNNNNNNNNNNSNSNSNSNNNNNNNNVDSVDTSGESDRLLFQDDPKRNVTAAYAFAMSLLNTSPTSSLFFNVPLILAAAGTSAPYALLATIFLCLSLSRTLQLFVRWHPSAGSFFTYSTLSLGPFAGLFTAWIMLIAYLALGVQAVLQIALFSSDVAKRYAYGNNASDDQVAVPFQISLVVFTIVVTLLSVKGIESSLRISIILSAIEAIIVSVFVGAMLVDGNHFLPDSASSEENPNGAFGFIQAVVLAVLVCDGFEGATSLAEEAKDPVRVVAFSVFGSVICVSGFVWIGTLALVWGLGKYDAANILTYGTNGGKSAGMPMNLLAQHYVSSWFGYFIDIAGMTTSFNWLVAQLNFNARLLMSMGHADIFHLGYFGKLHPTRQTPVRAIIATNAVCAAAAILLAFVYSVELSYTSNVAGTIDWNLVGSSSSGGWSAFAASNLIGSYGLLTVYMLPNLGIAAYIKKSHPSSYNRLDHLIRPAITVVAVFATMAGLMYPLPSVVGGCIIGIFVLWVLVGAFMSHRFVKQSGNEALRKKLLDLGSGNVAGPHQTFPQPHPPPGTIRRVGSRLGSRHSSVLQSRDDLADAEDLDERTRLVKTINI
eukprot:ANDGO_00347.mRNA.1 putative amino acid permease YecA